MVRILWSSGQGELCTGYRRVGRRLRARGAAQLPLRAVDLEDAHARNVQHSLSDHRLIAARRLSQRRHMTAGHAD